MEIAAVALGEYQVMHAAPNHHHTRLVRAAVGGHGDQAAGHHRRNRRLQIAGLEGNPSHDVVQREDAERHPAVLIDDHHRVGTPLVEEEQRVTHAGCRRDGQRLAAYQRAQRHVRRERRDARCRIST
ncbi:MAG: hypothetical protein AW07_00497 [Candidatus Accumulibacter sp. SK-11]|nr:MAG: hypothetical protein AW07_00497 [Candidatus Accumulibacter sp. SK-11]